MGKTKRLISLITIETAVLLMFFSQYYFILAETIHSYNFTSNFVYLAEGYLYIIKYIAALIIMYLIMRDRKSVVIGIIGMAYVLLSGIYLFVYFFRYYDYETPLLEQFFIYFDPLIIYIAFAIVFICFIREKGKKPFLFILTLAVIIADMIVGSVYYYGYVTDYSYADGIYSGFESYLLNVINTDFYFYWCLCCFIFAVETILILLFAIPARKKESEETKDFLEKDEEIKISTILITVLVSLLLSFFTIIFVLRPLIKSCTYSNYEDSFVHKTIEKIPQFADSLEKISPEKIKSECPFETSDAEWVFYPKDNMVGFVATAKEYGDRDNTIILVFRYLKSAESISDTIINYKYLSGYARYGYFDFDNREICEEKQFYYVKLVYDNRIVDPQTIMFDKDDERVNIDMPDDNIELSYHYHGKQKFKSKYQNYDASTGKWGEITNNERSSEPETGIPYSHWTQLQVVDGANFYKRNDGFVIIISEYYYAGNQYNIYGEIDVPQETYFSISIYNPNENLSDEILSEINNVKLYMKNGESYKDITPKDFNYVKYGSSKDRAEYELKSNTLGELTEGDYTFKYGDYDVNFELKVQTFEAW